VALLQRDEGPPPEALIPMPAFEQYAVSASACGARVVAVSPRGDLDLALKGVLAAITRATRLVFLASPANPTGLVVPADALVTIARALPPQGALFLDEAYVEFAEGSALALLDSMPSLVIGRTFSKAYGLAALRLGALLAAPSLIDRMRRVVPPYSLNACAIAALPAALDDEAFTRGYLAEVVESRRLLYDACERFGWRYWPSAANFVLIRVGERAGALVDALGARGIHVRDRSRQPGCEGCIRVTAGVVAHTRACIDAMEAFQCEAR
jgi:histidinol-phosphate aminotransferase